MPELAPKSRFGSAWESSRLASKEGWVLDPQNRVVILHGINISGGTKMPFYKASAAKAVGEASLQKVAHLSSLSAQEFFGAAPRAPMSATSTSAATISTSTARESSSATANASATLAKENGAARAKNQGAVPGVVYGYTEENFFEHREVSFVNRPFTLEEAELHFERLARWGCQCLRILVPWEALEHAAPGIYDEDYIDYLINLLKVAAKYGLKCFLDPHVDCWSRFTGGSGMPGWTIELAGLDMKKFEQTGAAIVENTFEDKENFPRMIWATNSIKVAAATMYTLFFAGQIFAPQAMVPLSTTVLAHLRGIHSTVVSDEAYRRGVPGGIKAPSPVQNLIPIPRTDQEFVERGQVNIQHYLQAHFMESFAHLALRIREDDMRMIGEGRGPGLIDGGTVMGFDSLNEPSPGYLNHPDLNKLLELADLQIGTCPTPIQGLQLAQGMTVECQVWETGGLGPMKKGTMKVNPDKINLWKRPYWRARNRNKRNHDSIYRDDGLCAPTTPAVPSPAYHPGVSPFDAVSHLDVSTAHSEPAPIPSNSEQPLNPGETLSAPVTGPLTPTKIAESHLCSVGWPEPVGYSDHCLWAEHKVWDSRTGKLLKPNYFQRIPTGGYVPPELQPGKEVEWKQDFWLPFVNTFSLRLRQQDPRFTIFVEPPINEAPPMFRLNRVLLGGAQDGLRNMVRSVMSWKPFKSFQTQHTTSIIRQQDPPVPQMEQTANGTGDDNTDNSNRTPSTSVDDLYHNASQHAIFNPLGDVNENVIVAPHFYDGYSNVTRDFVPFTLDYLGYKRGIYWSVLGALKFGWTGVEQAWKDQVKGIQSDIRFAMGQQHGILMGETGLPMDMHDKASFKHRYGNPKQAFAMKLMLDAMDANMLSFTLWNYCADNSNQWGDRWNGEDFSVWCPPGNMYLEPDFQESIQQAIMLPDEFGAPDAGHRRIIGHRGVTGVAGNPDQLATQAITSPYGPDVTLTEISSEMGTGKEVAGCSEGCIWWLCLPRTNVWTKRTALQRMVVVSVEPTSSTGSAEDIRDADANAMTANNNNNKKPKNLATLRTWQDLLPLSLLIEQSRLEFYGGLRVGVTFVRAYPLAIWGEPVQYQFEPGRPLADSEFVSKDAAKTKTNDVYSWENRFVLFLTLACERPLGRDLNLQEQCQREEISYADNALSRHGHKNIHNNNSNNSATSDMMKFDSPSTDIFLPRYHFSMNSPLGVDQFESLNYLEELQDDLRRRPGHHFPPRASPVRKDPKDKGRWHRFDVRVSDGHFSVEPERQILHYWTSPQPHFNPNDNLVPTAEFFDRVELRIRQLFALGWDGIQGITTAAEQEWIKQLWREIQKADAEAEASVIPSTLSYLFPYRSRARKMGSVELEESKKLLLKELQQRWRDKVGLPCEGTVYCHTCGQTDLMHVHGLSARLQLWSGYRGREV